MSYKVTSSVKFCLSYEPLKLGFRLQIITIPIRIRFVDMDVVHYVMRFNQSEIIKCVVKRFL